VLRPTNLALAALTALGAWSLAEALPQMPPYLATHFGGGGVPNGWMSQGRYMGFSIAMWLVIVASFWTTRFLVNRTPTRLVSVPNKHYWFTPERRAESIARLSDRMEIAGLVTIAGSLGVHEMIYAANRLPQPLLDERPFVTGLALYGVFLVGWIVELMLSFRVPKGVQ